LFGANKTSTAFGGGTNTTPGTGTSMFGGGGSAFGGGSNTTSGFGGATNNPGIGTNVGDPPGTAVLAFTPSVEKEPNSTAQNSFQNILFQEPYKKFSIEELRMADYAQGRQYGNGPAGGGGAFGAPSGFGGGFGNNPTQNTGFGNTNTGTGLFGNTQNNATTTGFGNTPNAGGFGAGATGGGGLFGGQNKPATGGGLFGNSTTTSQPAPAGGLFGATGGTTGGFGTANTATTGFGGNTGGGLFGNTPNKPATTTGFGGGFGGGTTGTGFGANAGTSTGFGQNPTNTGGGLFGNTNTQQTNTGGGLFGNTTQQQPQSTGFGAGGFGTNNTQQAGGGLFGNQNKPAATTGGGLFGNTGTQQNAGGGLFGNNTTANAGAFGNTQQQGGGGLFGGANKPATGGGGLFGNSTAGQPGQAGGGLFGGLGSNTQTQQQQPGTTSLFGGLGGNQNQNKPSLFGQTGQPAGGGLFGNQNTQQPGGGLFGQSTAQQPQQNALGNSLFGASQNSQPGPQTLTASIGDVNAYGTPSLFSGLGNGEVQNPGPLATPLSGKKKERKGSILPMWKLNPGSSTRFNTPVKRGFGFSYSTYGSPATPSSAGSTPGGFGQSLLGTGSLNRSLSKSVSSSNLRKSFNAEDSILTPGSFSSSMGTRPYGSAGLKKLNIDKSLRLDLFSSPSREKQIADSPGPRKLPKRVSFDTSLDASENGTLDGTPGTPSASAQDLGFIRPTNGGTLTTNGVSKSPDAQPEMEQVKGNELAIVHEEASTPSAPQDAASSPSKEAGAYWLSPSKEEILKMNRVQRAQVPSFTVGRQNVGQVQFKAPVDLTNIDLDEIPGGIVVLETRSCTVYPIAAKKPPVGKGLNVPSEISLEHSWPRGRDKRTPIPEKSGRAFNKHVERLKKIPDTKFIDYNAETGVWTFEVEHFTTYGLDYDEEDTEGDTLAEVAQEDAALPAPPVSSFQVEHEHPEPEDTFESSRKRRALPGAFDYTGAVSDDEEEMADANEQSFLSNCSAGSLSKALEHHEDEIMDEEHALPEAQDTSAYLGYHQAAEPDYDSPYHGSMAEYQETPGGIMRARMRAIKDSNAPFKLQVADGDDWMDMLQKTIGPAKRDRAALKAINEEETYDDLKASIRQDAPQAKPRAVPDGRGFATSIELMNSLFEKPKAPARAAPAPIPTSGFKVGTTSVC
jgi:nuclear pore complex protein Nup98-Nup96